jgi:hypothetical protein
MEVMTMTKLNMIQRKKLSMIIWLHNAGKITTSMAYAALIKHGIMHGVITTPVINVKQIRELGVKTSIIIGGN